MQTGLFSNGLLHVWTSSKLNLTDYKQNIVLLSLILIIILKIMVMVFSYKLLLVDNTHISVTKDLNLVQKI